MSTVIFGWIMVLIGILSLLAGIGGGIATMILDIRKRAASGRDFGVLDLPTDFIKAMTELLKALTAAPQWLALTVIGLILLFLGARMT